VSQISPPIRIVLVAAVAFLGAWMLFLRPKTESTGPTKPAASATAPGVKGLSSAVDKAKGASAASDAANAKIQAASGEAKAESGSTAAADKTSKPGTPAGKAASGDTAGLPVRVQKALDQKKVLVLFFYNPKSADDLAVRRAVKKVDRWEGEVVVQSADVKSVARYTKVAKGADVEQTPTVVVVDRNAKAERLVGFQDTRSIDQAVVDAMRNSGVLIKDPYFSKLNKICRSAGDAMFAIPDASQPGAEVRTVVHTYENRIGRFVSDFKAVPAPARWRAFKKASVAELAVETAFVHKLVRGTGDGTRLAPILAVIKAETPAVHKAEASFNARMDKHHVLSCGSNT
jgi:hypothetical protein